MSIASIQRPPAGLVGQSPNELLAHLANLAAPAVDGATYRPYEAFTILASAARTGTSNGASIYVPAWARGFHVQLDCTLAGAAGSIKPQIYAKVDLLTASLILCNDTVGLAAAIGTRNLAFAENLAAVGASTWNVAANGPLTPIVGVQVTHATADSYTYSVRGYFTP